MGCPDAGPEARQRTADLQQARVVQSSAYLCSGVEHVPHLVSEDRRRGLSVLDGKRSPEATALSWSRELDELQSANSAEQRARRLADL